VFAVNASQREAAEAKRAEVDASGKWRDPVVTEVNQGGTFWRAEEYHQRYFEKNGAGFCKV
jgi:peptide-methionine (S)-S-oxide reductase